MLPRGPREGEAGGVGEVAQPARKRLPIPWTLNMDEKYSTTQLSPTTKER